MLSWEKQGTLSLRRTSGWDPFQLEASKAQSGTQQPKNQEMEHLHLFFSSKNLFGQGELWSLRWKVVIKINFQPLYSESFRNVYEQAKILMAQNHSPLFYLYRVTLAKLRMLAFWDRVLAPPLINCMTPGQITLLLRAFIFPSIKWAKRCSHTGTMRNKSDNTCSVQNIMSKT